MNKMIELREVAELITKGTTPTTIGGSFTNTGINFVKSESICDSKYLDSSAFMKIDDITNEKLKRSKLKEGDLLISIAGAYLGKLSIVRDIDLPANTNQAVGIVRINPKKVDVNYLYYYFMQPVMNGHINKLSAQSSQPNLNLDLLGKLTFNCIELDYQSKIAAVLSAIDQKIELNNRINTELEAMAKTLYDYWFVQFDFPGANGKPYKSSGGKMEYNATLKREIPEGWDVQPITDCCEIVDCLHSKKPEQQFFSPEYFLLQLENIRDDGLIDLTSKYFVSQQDYTTWTDRIEVKKYDVVMTNAGRIAAFAQIPLEINCGIGRNITAIRPNKIYPNYFFSCLSGLDTQRQILTNLDHGAFFKSFNVKGIKALKIVKPVNEVEEKFEQLISPMIEKRHAVLLENLSLNNLRDWLLPMLMNGQVTVSSATQPTTRVPSYG